MVLPAFILLPLYLYPDNTSSWSTLTTSIVSNPSLDFHVIVSPNLTTNPLPDANYITALSAINSYPNVLTFGYVYASYGDRDVADIEQEVDLYAALAEYTAADIAVDGIFFDEAPSDLTSLPYMSAVSAYARSVLGAEKDYIFFNPGVPVDAAFYLLADSINIFEGGYANYSTTVLESIGATLLGKSTYAIHDFNGTIEQQAELVDTLVGSNLAGIYITTASGYESWSDLWEEFCQEVDEVNSGGGAVGNSTTTTASFSYTTTSSSSGLWSNSSTYVTTSTSASSGIPSNTTTYTPTSSSLSFTSLNSSALTSRHTTRPHSTKPHSTKPHSTKPHSTSPHTSRQHTTSTSPRPPYPTGGSGDGGGTGTHWHKRGIRGL